MAKFNKLDFRRLDEIASRTISCQPFVNDTPVAQENRIKKVSAGDWKSFVFFAKTYFPHIVELDFCTAHRFMFHTVERNSGVTAITGFRGLGKSAMFGFIYPVWKIINGERYVIYGAANIEQSNEKADFIRHEFENNKRLLCDFPFLKIKDTDDNVFYLSNNTKIRAVSIKQTIRGTINSRVGKRPGLIILDDIDKETNVGNVTIGKRKKEKIIHEIRGALAPDGVSKVLWLGNLTHPNFAICQFKKQILDEMCSNGISGRDNNLCLYGDEKRLIQIPLERNGKSMWEAQYPTSSLPALKKELGMIGFLREMQGKSLIDGIIFKASWFVGGRIPPDKEMREVWLYIDSAWGKKGCFRSIFAVGWTGFHYYILKAWCRQCENSKMFEYLYQTFFELKTRFGVRVRFSFEANFGQQRLMTDFDNWCHNNGVGTISHYFKPIYNTENKNLRIEALEPVIESGKVIFPEGQDMPVVIGQFTSYPQGYVDAPDALAGCMARFHNFSRKNRVSVKGGFR